MTGMSRSISIRKKQAVLGPFAIMTLFCCGTLLRHSPAASRTTDPLLGIERPASGGLLVWRGAKRTTVGSTCAQVVEACSTFTRVAACTLALSPIRDTLIEGFTHFVTSMTALIASGWSDCLV